MKKRSLAILLSGFMAFALTACGSGTSSSAAGSETPAAPAVSTQKSSTQNSGTKTQTATGEVTIEIKPPSGWNPVQGAVIPVQYMKTTASFMVKKEGLMAQAKTLDDVIVEAKQQLEKSFKDISYDGEPKMLTIDGKDAKELTFSCTISSMKMKLRYEYLFVNEKVYVIVFGDLSSHFDTLSADYEQILKDIRFR